jgi:zinc protease
MTLAAAIGIAPVAAAQPRDDLAFFAHVDRSKLSNGLELILHEDHRAPFVMVSLSYHVGHRDDPQGQNGLAHIFEHLMFEGSQHVPGGHKSWLARLKTLSANATTHLDRTRYFELVPSANLEAALWLESDRMGFLFGGLDAGALDRAREAVRQERAQKVGSKPYAAGGQHFQAALFPPKHPYGRPGTGSDRELDAIRDSDLHAFAEKFYVPANATLVLTGDFQTDQVKALVKKYFETLPAGTRHTSPEFAVAAQEQEVVAHEAEPLGNMTVVAVGWRTPAFFAPGDAAADLLAEILTAGSSSRLGRRLDQKERLTLTTRAHQLSHADVSEFTIDLVLQRGADPQRALAALDAELAELAEKGPTPDEMAAALARRELQLVHGLDGVGGLGRIANVIQLYVELLSDPGGILRDRERYRAVTAADVRDFVRTSLERRRRVVYIFDPVKQARPGDAPMLPDDAEGDR